LAWLAFAFHLAKRPHVMPDRSVSRGEVISLIAGIPLAVTSAASAASVPTPAAAPGLLTIAQMRANYKYVDKAPNPAQGVCATCYAFRPVYGPATPAPQAAPSASLPPAQGPLVSATCLLVPGPVLPGGWCTVWGLNPSLKTK
jgi:hypothetical protein